MEKMPAAAHESHPLLAQLIVRRVQMDFTEFCASCNVFSHIKHACLMHERRLREEHKRSYNPYAHCQLTRRVF